MGKEVVVEEAEVKVEETGEGARTISPGGRNTAQTPQMAYVIAIIDTVRKVGIVPPPTPALGWTRLYRSHEGPASLEKTK